MGQSTYNNTPGSDVFMFKTLDQSGNDITAQCTYTATSRGTAVTFGPVSGNTVPLTNVAGTDTLTITTADAGFAVPNVVLAATITSPPPPAVPGTTTVGSQTGTIS